MVSNTINIADKPALTTLTRDKFQRLIDFSKIAFPKREYFWERFQYNVLGNPLLKDKDYPSVIIALNREQQIIGQLICNPCEMYLAGKTLRVSHCYDFYVLKGYRGKSIGTKMAKIASEDFKPFITVGVTEDAKNIDLSCGGLIGCMNKFIWFRNLLNPVKAAASSVFRKNMTFNPDSLNSLEPPEVLSQRNFNFRLTKSFVNWKDFALNDHILQFARSTEFLEWRFIQRANRYFSYISNDFMSYFVVRSSIYRGLNVLEIVDYRVSDKNSKAFESILSACKMLVSLIKYDGIITMSSHRFFDQILKKNMFLRIGKPQIIISNIETNSNKEVISSRNLIYATITDCDNEFLSI